MSANSDRSNRRNTSSRSNSGASRKFPKKSNTNISGQKKSRSAAKRNESPEKPAKDSNSKSTSNHKRTDKPRFNAKDSKRPDSRSARSKERTNSSDRSSVQSTRSYSKEKSNKPRSSQQRTTGKFDIPRRFQGDQPRRERDQRARGNAPIIDQDVNGDELGEELTSELNSLPTGLTITVAQHLVMAQRYLEINPELALIHANHAKELAGRFPIVREICGIANYVNGKWQEALNEFRAVKRMSTADHLIPMMADCERGLGRPTRAIELLDQNSHLTGVVQIEAAIVKSGARTDLKQLEAALVALKIPALAGFPADLTSYARLCFAYAKALMALGRDDEAQVWFRKADASDPAATLASEYLSNAENAVYLDDLDAS